MELNSQGKKELTRERGGSHSRKAKWYQKVKGLKIPCGVGTQRIRTVLHIRMLLMQCRATPLSFL